MEFMELHLEQQLLVFLVMQLVMGQTVFMDKLQLELVVMGFMDMLAQLLVMVLEVHQLQQLAQEFMELQTEQVDMESMESKINQTDLEFMV